MFSQIRQLRNHALDLDSLNSYQKTEYSEEMNRLEEYQNNLKESGQSSSFLWHAQDLADELAACTAELNRERKLRKKNENDLLYGGFLTSCVVAAFSAYYFCVKTYNYHFIAETIFFFTAIYLFTAVLFSVIFLFANSFIKLFSDKDENIYLLSKHRRKLWFIMVPPALISFFYLFTSSLRS